MVAVWISVVLIVSVLAGLLTVSPKDSKAQANPTLQNIIIKADGTVTPSDAPIVKYDNIYKLTGDVYGTIRIMKSNVVINGAALHPIATIQWVTDKRVVSRRRP
jgi:hypothetical protein